MSKGLKNVLTILVIVSLSLGGMYFYRINDSRLSALSQASLGWSSVDGLVVHSTLKTTTSQNRKRHTTHRVRVIYEYVVNGRSYNNDIVRFDQNSSLSRKEKEQLVSSHPVGKTVEVFFNPDNPKQSVLVRGSYE